MIYVHQVNKYQGVYDVMTCEIVNEWTEEWMDNIIVFVIMMEVFMKVMNE